MNYLMAGQLSEPDRLQIQSGVWEPAGRALLGLLGDGEGKRALDIGCGCYGWIPLLADWVGTTGSCVGAEIDEMLLGSAQDLIRRQALDNVELVRDDLFASGLESGTFDLVHARFLLAPLGRWAEQLDTYLRLLRPGGTLVLEEPETASWTQYPASEPAQRLIALILRSFADAGGDLNAGRALHGLLTERGLNVGLRADVVALPPGHPYLALPQQFAASLRPRLLEHVAEDELDRLIADCAHDTGQADRWGLTFTLIQAWATKP